jgi:hypothetical protein
MFRVQQVGEGSVGLSHQTAALAGIAFASCWCAMEAVAPIKGAVSDAKAETLLQNHKIREKNPGDQSSAAPNRFMATLGLE